MNNYFLLCRYINFLCLPFSFACVTPLTLFLSLRLVSIVMKTLHVHCWNMAPSLTIVMATIGLRCTLHLLTGTGPSLTFSLK